MEKSKNIVEKIKNSKWVSPIRQPYHKYCFSDIRFIKKFYKRYLNREVNLENPKWFSDKLQWLKLYWYDPIAVQCADKYEVRGIVAKKIGTEFLNDIYGVYDSVDDIDLSRLPDSFVLKATHSSGYNFVCRNKALVNWKLKFKELRKWLKINYFWSTREWVYKEIKPRILCERFLSEGQNSTSLTDYKIYCFNGKPMFCQVIQNRKSGKVGTIDFFDTEWNHMEFTGLQKAPHSTKDINKPERYKEMLELAAELSNDFPFVRVDFYYVNGNIYFGEMTFFPKSGFGQFYPPKWNEKIGNLLKLPLKQ